MQKVLNWGLGFIFHFNFFIILFNLQRSWVNASKKQRDELLDFIRHLAEDDKEGVMATKVIT